MLLNQSRKNVKDCEERLRKARENGTKDNWWTGVRTSGETNTPPSWLARFA